MLPKQPAGKGKNWTLKYRQFDSNAGAFPILPRLRTPFTTQTCLFIQAHSGHTDLHSFPNKPSMSLCLRSPPPTDKSSHCSHLLSWRKWSRISRALCDSLTLGWEHGQVILIKSRGGRMFGHIYQQIGGSGQCV